MRGVGLVGAACASGWGLGWGSTVRRVRAGILECCAVLADSHEREPPFAHPLLPSARCPGCLQCVLLRRYDDAEIALQCGQMLRDCIRHDAVARLVLESHIFTDMFGKLEMTNFEVASGGQAVHDVRMMCDVLWGVVAVRCPAGSMEMTSFEVARWVGGWAGGRVGGWARKNAVFLVRWRGHGWQRVGE